MKISKLILACVLGSMVGNAFAEPVRIICKFDDPEIEKQPEIEFDDKNSSTVSIDGKMLPYTYNKGRNKNGKVELKEFNASTIAWLDEYESSSSGITNISSWFYEINRKTGRIAYTFKFYDSYSEKTDVSTHRGTCTKMANNGF